MEFKGIDLSTKYIHPSTWDWLAAWVDDDINEDKPVMAHVYDGGYGIIIWTYASDPEDERIPIDLQLIISEAYEHGWRFIVLDCDGNDCDWLVSHEEEWN